VGLENSGWFFQDSNLTRAAGAKQLLSLHCFDVINYSNAKLCHSYHRRIRHLYRRLRYLCRRLHHRFTLPPSACELLPLPPFVPTINFLAFCTVRVKRRSALRRIAELTLNLVAFLTISLDFVTSTPLLLIYTYTQDCHYHRVSYKDDYQCVGNESLE
jgi:hypothetical protein